MLRAKSRQAGFTLVELLVVIAIISVLAAMLLPALKSTLDTARFTQCTGNFKQIGLACAGYLSDYNDFFPGPGLGINYEGHTVLTLKLLRPYYWEGQSGRYYWTADDKLLPTLPLEKCPADKYAANTDHFGHSRVSKDWRASFYRQPSRTPMILESDFWNSGFYGKMYWWCDGFVFTRHGPRLNFWFIDGHVATVKPYDKEVNATWLWNLHTSGKAND